jgi:hypothetical protein
MAPPSVYPWTGQSVRHMLRYIREELKQKMTTEQFATAIGCQRERTVRLWWTHDMQISVPYKRKLTHYAQTIGFPFYDFYDRRGKLLDGTKKEPDEYQRLYDALIARLAEVQKDSDPRK